MDAMRSLDTSYHCMSQLCTDKFEAVLPYSQIFSRLLEGKYKDT